MKVHLISILKVLIIMMYIIAIITNISLAKFDVTSNFTGEIKNTASVKPIKTILSTVLDVVRMVGTGIALIMLTYIGIKIMVAAPSERANIKQYAINYVIGAFILIGASGILTIVKEFTKGAFE